MKKNLFSYQPIVNNLKGLLSGVGVAIGLDLGSSSIKIAELKKTQKGFLLNNYIFTIIPPEIRFDEAKQTEFIINTVKQAFKDGKLTATGAYFALSGKEVNVLSLSLPKVAKRDLANAIIIEIKKRIPFNEKDFVLNFQVSAEIPDRAGPKLQILAAIASKKAIDKKIKIIEAMGLHPLGINIIPNAFSNVLKGTIASDTDEVIALLDIGAKLSTLAVFKGGDIQFTREIATGGDHFTQGLVRKVTVADKEVNITLEQAEKIKRDCGIPKKEELEQKIDVFTKSHVLAMIRPTLERLTTDVLRSINFYRQSSKMTKVERILLTGGGSRLKNLEEFLAANLKEIKVERFDPLTIVTGWSDPSISDQELLEDLAPQLSVAFGLAIGKKEKGIDLLPFEIKLQEKFKTIKFILKITVPIITAVLFLFYMVLSAQTSHYRRLLSQAQITLKSFESTKLLIQEFDDIASRMQQRKMLLEKAVGRQPLWEGILKELGQIGPQGVTLDSLAVIRETRPKELKLEGEIVPSYTTVDIALSQYLLALDESPFFENVELVSQARDIYSATAKARFEITLKLIY